MVISSRDLAAERAAIEARIAGQTLVSAFADTVERLAGAEAVRWKDGGEWRALTWREYRQILAEVTLGLVELGAAPGDVTLILGRNRPEALIADLAAQHARGVPVFVYNTLPPQQVAYIARQCQAGLAIVENHEFLRLLQGVRDQVPSLRRVVVLEPDHASEHGGWSSSWQALRELGQRALGADPTAFERLRRQVRPDNLAALVYTSGTTGRPKGVMLSHRNVLWEAAATARLHAWRSGERIVSYLPLAHVNARWVDVWSHVILGSTISCCPDPRLIFDYVREVRPTVLVGVPRVWEKLCAALQAAGGSSGEGLLARVGLDACERAYTGAAPIDPRILEFFQALGVPLTEAWGMTELTCAAAGAPIEEQRNGTIGRPLEGVEMRLAQDGEILVRAGCIMQGYYKEPTATAEAIDAEGWLHTGDLGAVDADGYYRVVGRKKDMLITSGGKNIAPAPIETSLQEHPLIGHAVAIGDRRPYVTALLVLDVDAAPVWARAHGVADLSLAALAGDPRVLEAVAQAVQRTNAHLARVEQVKRFRVLPVEWTPLSGELTPTLKVRRDQIVERYAAEIEDLYR